MARRNDGLLLYAIVGAIAYLGYQLVKPKPVTGSAPATNAGDGIGGGVPGSPNQVLDTTTQEFAKWLKGGGTYAV